MENPLAREYVLRQGERPIEKFCCAAEDDDGSCRNFRDLKKDRLAGICRETNGLLPGQRGSFSKAGIQRIQVIGSVVVGDVLVVADSAGRGRAMRLLERDDEVIVIGRSINKNDIRTGCGLSVVKCIITMIGEFV